MKNIDIVIARYNEDLRWIGAKPFNKYNCIVYNKSKNFTFYNKNIKRIINLPNVGRCDHTYLYHIIENYDNLADITVFLPGSCDIEFKFNLASRLLNIIENSNNAVLFNAFPSPNLDLQTNLFSFCIDSYTCTHPLNFNINNEINLKPSFFRPYGVWFRYNFGNITINTCSMYGIFSICKEDILQHPKERYQKYLDELSNHSNPEVGHYYERSWPAVFYPLNCTTIIKLSELQ